MNKNIPKYILIIVLTALIVAACSVSIFYIAVFMPKVGDRKGWLREGVYTTDDDCVGIFGNDNVRLEVVKKPYDDLNGEDALGFLPDEYVLSIYADETKFDFRVVDFDYDGPSDFRLELFGAENNQVVECRSVYADSSIVMKNADCSLISFIWERAL